MFCPLNNMSERNTFPAIEKSVFEEYLVNANTFSKYLNTLLILNHQIQMQIQILEKIQILMYLTPSLDYIYVSSIVYTV